MNGGLIKRFWGAYGKPPDDKAALAQGPYDSTAVYQQFRGPVHCADVSVDDLVYVCDRTSNRLQVFKPEGTFIREIYTQRDSRSDGSVWDVAFSRDAQQRFLYIADGRNPKIRLFDRQSLTELTTFGKGGQYPGEWYSLHSIATDSKGKSLHDRDLSGPASPALHVQGSGAGPVEAAGRRLSSRDPESLKSET